MNINQTQFNDFRYELHHFYENDLMLYLERNSGMANTGSKQLDDSLSDVYDAYVAAMKLYDKLDEEN